MIIGVGAGSSEGGGWKVLRRKSNRVSIQGIVVCTASFCVSVNERVMRGYPLVIALRLGRQVHLVLVSVAPSRLDGNTEPEIRVLLPLGDLGKLL